MARKRKYTKDVLTPAVLQSTSFSNLCIVLGLVNARNTRNALKRYVEEYGIDTTHFTTKHGRPKGTISPRYTDAEVFIENSPIFGVQIRTRLKNIGVDDTTCMLCGLSKMWNGKPIQMQVDHINGIRSDNRLENLRIVCPNCHTQTETHSRTARKESNEEKNMD
jgi:5-methylcytosine-specific restriction endonuclease McrA